MKPQPIIKRIILTCDQHTVLDLENNGQPSKEQTVTLYPTVRTADLIRKYHHDVAVTFLTDHAERPVVSPYLPPTVEYITADRRKADHTFATERTRGIPKHETLFISADRIQRTVAVKQGMRAVPHPAMASWVLEGQGAYFAEWKGSASAIKQQADFIPYYVHTEGDQLTALGATTREAIVHAATRGITVNVYPVDLALHDVLLVRVDHWDSGAVARLGKQTIIACRPDYALIALDSDFNEDMLHLHGQHGHYTFLMPGPEMLRDNPAPAQDALAGFNQQQIRLISTIRQDLLEHMPVHQDLSIYPGLLFPRCASHTTFQNIVDRYSGVAALDAAGTIASREVRHPDNARVVAALLKDLRDMGYCAWTHNFTFGGRTAKNVIAELPGRGIFRLPDHIFEKIKTILRIPSPHDIHQNVWLQELEDILGADWAEQLRFDADAVWDKRLLTEIQLGIYPHPHMRCPQPGFGARTVIVGCHLDSTAAGSGPYNPATDPAPGADDDASGIAGTLSVARYLVRFRGMLRHTVRFCFFNAEEAGIVGSQAYAAYLKANNTPVKAVVCMDMIGYNTDTQRIFEVHAGYTDAAIRDLSVPIANQVAASAGVLGRLAPAQIYKGTSSGSGADRNVYDGAIGRSDHASFHAQGYPAVVVSEDFFVNQSGEPAADGNPNYHRNTDTVIDSAYGADIACAVAHAVKELAS